MINKINNLFIYLNCPHSPLEQFDIIPLFNFFSIPFFDTRFTFTNSSFFLLAIFFLLSVTFYFSAVYNVFFFSGKWQALVEELYFFILDVVQDTIGDSGLVYFPFMFVSFFFILICNLLGMVPYTFTVTSHFLITFSLGMATFIGINIIGFSRHGLHFFSFFMPKDAPLGLIPFLVLIELVSYIFRVFSLSIRLFANMMAGHTLLKILAGFSWTMLNIGGIFYIIQLFPLLVVVALTGLELAIGFLQAYVWLVLICIYLNDALHLH